MRSKLLCLAAMVVLTSSFAFALTLEEPLRDAAQEARARALFHELRCVVCQSETLADSPADVARDMRREIRSQVAAGKTEQEIKSYLTSRYGDVILMRPPLSADTVLLWLSPLLILALALALTWKYFRRKA